MRPVEDLARLRINEAIEVGIREQRIHRALSQDRDQNRRYARNTMSITSHMKTRKRLSYRLLLATLLVIIVALFLALPAFAHPHEASPADQGAGQVIANGQNHAPFNADGTTCGGDPAAYGLETAHHGPDSGTPGKADGCYQVDSMPPSSDDHNPAID